MSLSLSKLNSFSKDVYIKIIARHPEWEQYAKVKSDREIYLSVEVPSPVPRIFSIEITTLEDEEDEITLYFGPAHFHMGMYMPDEKDSVSDQLDGVDEITQKIFNEELIAIQKKPGLFFVAEALVSQDDYKELLDNGKLRRAVSWKGTFNYPHFGIHADWDPPG